MSPMLRKRRDARRTSANRLLAEPIETGIQSNESEKNKFFEQAYRLSTSSDPVERKRIREALARMTFGE